MTVCYREIREANDSLKNQKDVGRLGFWARKWGMRFQPVKCSIMQITRKITNKTETYYILEGTVLENVDTIKYLGMTRWNTHISNMCTKANRTLGFLRQNLLLLPVYWYALSFEDYHQLAFSAPRM